MGLNPEQSRKLIELLRTGRAASSNPPRLSSSTTEGLTSR